jgi:uncharacterized protein (DUF58 family)
VYRAGASFPYGVRTPLHFDNIMIPSEILNHIRRIEFATDRVVNDLFAGRYASVFRGRGMEFDEVREYVPGDDVRSIDWNVSARHGRPFVKKFIEERELTIMLLLDTSASQRYGSGDKRKAEVTAEIACIVAFAALRSAHRIGAVFFTDSVERYLPPRRSKQHALRIVRDILYHQPASPRTDLRTALERFYCVQKKRCIAFLFSDFLDEGFEQSLRVVDSRHDLILLRVSDPREYDIGVSAWLELRDMETGALVTADLTGADRRARYCAENDRRTRNLEAFCRSAGIDLVDIRTDRPYIEPLVRFFAARERRLAAG